MDNRYNSKEDNELRNYERVKDDTPSLSEAATKNEAAFDSYDYLGNSCSAWECTGLIPSAPQSDAELESYEDLYRFEAPRMAPEENKDKARQRSSSQE